jgi:hypothetical protein
MGRGRCHINGKFNGNGILVVLTVGVTGVRGAVDIYARVCATWLQIECTIHKHRGLLHDAHTRLDWRILEPTPLKHSTKKYQFTLYSIPFFGSEYNAAVLFVFKNTILHILHTTPPKLPQLDCTALMLSARVQYRHRLVDIVAGIV